MSDSLRDQLLGLGFKPAPKPDKPVRPKHDAAPRSTTDENKPAPQSRRPQQGKPAQTRPGPSVERKPKTREEIDLAKAYAIRAQREKDERIEAEKLKQEEARQRREAKAALTEFLKDKALNDPAAEIARHFEYGGRIKRVYVNETQLKALNAGELGVIQNNGRYLLVTAESLAQAEALFAPAVALKIDPNAPVSDDPYADPQYQVPDDLVW
jgi:uncharacterized protein YaiL (DUF2058 family)